MRGIPEKYVKEITTLVWGFIWGGGINEIDRKVCRNFSFYLLFVSIFHHFVYYNYDESQEF
jgi:hypothetical protein